MFSISPQDSDCTFDAHKKLLINCCELLIFPAFLMVRLGLLGWGEARDLVVTAKFK